MESSASPIARQSHLVGDLQFEVEFVQPELHSEGVANDSVLVANVEVSSPHVPDHCLLVSSLTCMVRRCFSGKSNAVDGA